jgi:thiol:disulfide interchange protein
MEEIARRKSPGHRPTGLGQNALLPKVSGPAQELGSNNGLVLLSNRKEIRIMRTITSCILLSVLTAGASFAADQPAKPSRPAIYDRAADGNRQISEALKTAKAENKNVLLQFGANWCGWCHRLHDLFKADAEIAKTLKDYYVVVLIDVDQVEGKPHNQDVVQRYGNPTRFGLPVLVVLDRDGKTLITQDTGKLEEGDHHDPKKVLGFLEKWTPKVDSKG